MSVEEVIGKRGQDEAANRPQHLGSRFRVSPKKRDSELDLLEESPSKSRGLALVIADSFGELAIGEPVELSPSHRRVERSRWKTSSAGIPGSSPLSIARSRRSASSAQI